jgi:hypothetical protein
MALCHQRELAFESDMDAEIRVRKGVIVIDRPICRDLDA